MSGVHFTFSYSFLTMSRTGMSVPASCHRAKTVPRLIQRGKLLVYLANLQRKVSRMKLPKGEYYEPEHG